MGDDFHFFSVKGSRTADIINLPNLSNVGYPGKFAFRVDLRDIEPAPPPGGIVCIINKIIIRI